MNRFLSILLFIGAAQLRADDEQNKAYALEGVCTMQFKVQTIVNMRNKEKPGSLSYIRLTAALDALRAEGEGWLESYESYYEKSFDPKICYPAKKGAK